MKKIILITLCKKCEYTKTEKISEKISGAFKRKSLNQFLVSNNFIKAKFLSYGAILHELWVKNYENKYVNVIKGLKKRKNI